MGHENCQMCRATYTQIQQIHKLPFTLSNRVERFKHEVYVMPYPRAAIYIAIAWLSLHTTIIYGNVQHARTPTVNGPLPIVLFTVQLLSIWSRFHYIIIYEVQHLCPWIGWLFNTMKINFRFFRKASNPDNYPPYCILIILCRNP